MSQNCLKSTLFSKCPDFVPTNGQKRMQRLGWASRNTDIFFALSLRMLLPPFAILSGDVIFGVVEPS